VCQLCQAAELAKNFSGLLCFVQIFDENVNFLQAITFAKSTRSLMVPKCEILISGILMIFLS
jgi:hypothetical protein